MVPIGGRNPLSLSSTARSERAPHIAPFGALSRVLGLRRGLGSSTVTRLTPVWRAVVVSSRVWWVSVPWPQPWETQAGHADRSQTQTVAGSIRVSGSTRLTSRAKPCRSEETLDHKPAGPDQTEPRTASRLDIRVYTDRHSALNRSAIQPVSASSSVSTRRSSATACR
jgi:hypothetical protein